MRDRVPATRSSESDSDSLHVPRLRVDVYTYKRTESAGWRINNASAARTADRTCTAHPEPGHFRLTYNSGICFSNCSLQRRERRIFKKRFFFKLFNSARLLIITLNLCCVNLTYYSTGYHSEMLSIGLRIIYIYIRLIWMLQRSALFMDWSNSLILFESTVYSSKC